MSQSVSILLLTTKTYICCYTMSNMCILDLPLESITMPIAKNFMVNCFIIGDRSCQYDPYLVTLKPCYEYVNEFPVKIAFHAPLTN
jgi:hypothetical protein